MYRRAAAYSVYIQYLLMIIHSCTDPHLNSPTHSLLNEPAHVPYKRACVVFELSSLIVITVNHMAACHYMDCCAGYGEINVVNINEVCVHIHGGAVCMGDYCGGCLFASIVKSTVITNWKNVGTSVVGQFALFVMDSVLQQW